ncbi:hypothetical protein IIDPJIOB_00609 [Aeromonas veronii]|nr:hypothetical protein CT153_13360 [Aeromonas veronii]
MEYKCIIPSQFEEFGFIIEKPNQNHEVTLTKTPIIGYCIYLSETKNEEINVFTLPLCTVGENRDPTFIQRYDRTFTDVNGEQQFYSLIEVMSYYGYEPDDLETPFPLNSNDLSKYIWRPQRNPTDNSPQI